MNPDFSQLEAELENQNQQWAETQAQLLALGDVELAIDPDTLSELEEQATPKLAGTIPAGLTRA